MLPKSHRLSRKTLLELRKTGKRLQLDTFSVVFGPNHLNHLRLSTEISTKVDKRSSRRNAIRRQLYLHVQKTPLIAKSVDVLIIVRPTAKKLIPQTASFKQAVNLVVRALLV